MRGRTIEGMILVLTLGSGAWAATDYCGLTASDANRGCRSEATADNWIALGKCDNISNVGDRGDCKRDASAEKTDALDLCGDQLAARQDACEDLGTAAYEPDIDPADFVSVIDNPYFPLVPGTTFISEGGGEHVEFAVTHNTKVILGVTCTEVHDTVTVGGELKEDTRDWFAQDRDGNVWYFGEATAEYENGLPVTVEGSWEGGVDGARPGIVMKASPVVDQLYRQEFLLGSAEDLAEVKNLDRTVTIGYGTFRHCLETEETTPIEPDANEHKFYAPGIGFVLQTKPGTSDRLELIAIETE